MKRIALAALMLAACSRPAASAAPRDAAAASRDTLPAAADTSRAAAHDSASLWPERGAVMPIALMPDLLGQCSRSSPGKDSVQAYWTPDAAQIRELEAGLTPLLRDSLTHRAGSRAAMAQRLSIYHRQYAGLVMNGRRIIYVNGFVQSPLGEAPGDTMRWREAVYGVCDGGESFFGVEYDPATRRFRNLYFNGYA